MIEIRFKNNLPNISIKLRYIAHDSRQKHELKLNVIKTDKLKVEYFQS